MAVSSSVSEDFSDLGTPVDDFSDLGTPAAEDFSDLGTPADASQEVVAEEAQRATAGALQAVDVMAAPGKLDWSEVNEKLDAERFREANALQADVAGKISTPERRATFAKAQELLSQISPTTTVGKYLAAQKAGQEQASIEIGATEERGSTPSSLLSGLVGPGLAPTVVPVVEGAARNAGAAAGGALAAAKFVPGPVGVATRMSNFLATVVPIAAGIGGALAGSATQEKLLQSTETPEETSQRQQRASEDFERNPGLSYLGAMAASAPWFRPGIAQFGRAAAGDKGAILNLGVAGGLGGAMEVGSALARGDTVEARDVAMGIISNLLMNEPTKLGRKLGLKPSTEQMDAEARAIQAKQSPIPIGETVQQPITTTEPNAQQISKTGTIDGGVRTPEIPSENVALPAPEGGEGVQPSRPGEPLAEAAPAPPRKIVRSDEERVAELVAAGLTPEEAAAGVARAKVLEAPPPVEPPAQPTSELVPDAATSIKNAVTAAERAAREIPLAAEPDRRAWTQAWDEATADITQNPSAPDILLARLKAKPHALTDKEDALLLHRQIDLQKAYDSAAAEVNRAAEAGDEPARVEAKARLDGARDALQEVYDLGKQAGTESGRGLNARKMWANQDYNLAAMETRLRADQGGQKLDDSQLAKIKEQADTISKTQAEMDRILAERDALKSELEAAKKEDATVDPKVKSLADRIIARLDISAANAEKSLRSRLANLGSAPDPLIVLDVAKIAAARTAKGAVQFAQWSAEMIAKWGEKIRPFLQAGWDQREQIIDGEIGTGTKAAKAAKESASVMQEKRRLKALTRVLARAEAELTGAARRGKQQGPESQPVAEVRQKLKIVREQLQSKREADPAVRQAKIEAAEVAVEKAIRTLDEQLQAGDISVKRTPSKAGSQRLEDLRSQRDAMNRLRNELRAEARPKADPIETQVKGRLTAIANRTAEYERRTAAGDFSPMRKPPLDLSKNPEWVKAKAANDKAKSDYEKARYEARKAQRTTEQKVRDTIADVWSASRPILASTDISAPGRQGIFFSLPDLFSNPMRLGRQLRAMFRSQFNESKYQENEAAIKSRDNADLYEESELYLADIDHKPSAREEQFKSELAEKIPAIGRVVRGSARGFSAFMNTVRADAMDAFVKWSGGKEKLTPETAKFLAAAINDLSGRGNVSSRQAQGALEWLAKYLFSPRLWVSRFNTALLKPVWRDPLNRAISPRARAVVFGQYAKFTGALLALKWLAGLWGGKMEEDPRDSDFGKLQFGPKRYDVMGGIGNMVTLLARISTQKTVDDKGKELRIAWEDEKRPERELGQILFNHLRNKGAPIPGAVYDYIYGRHPDRSKVTPTSLLKQTTVPITVSDTVEFFRKDNPAAALRDTLINALGVSTDDYRK